jgi:CheY-like chemotaxis protein
MPSLLLVEDNQHIQRIFHDKLQREGFAVTTADDGQSGLQRATELRPDAILLDIMLPRMDGFEVLTHLRADPALSAIPVFMLSNRCTSNDVQHAASLGARHFFAKGTSTMQDIALQIRTICGFKKVLVSTSNVMTAAPILRALTHPQLLCSVVTVSAEVLAAAERGAPDLVVLDARGPNAFTLLQQFKTNPALKNFPLIAIRDHKQTQYHLDEFIDSERIDTELRPLVMKHLGLEEPAAVQPVAQAVPASA